jgi:hypothetical protein
MKDMVSISHQEKYSGVAALSICEACLMKIPAFVRNKSHRSAF